METCLDTPLDVLASLRHAILNRKGITCYFSDERATIEEKPFSDKVKEIFMGIDKTG